MPGVEGEDHYNYGDYSIKHKCSDATFSAKHPGYAFDPVIICSQRARKDTLDSYIPDGNRLGSMAYHTKLIEIELLKEQDSSRDDNALLSRSWVAIAALTHRKFIQATSQARRYSQRTGVSCCVKSSDYDKVKKFIQKGGTGANEARKQQEVPVTSSNLLTAGLTSLTDRLHCCN